MEEGGKGFGHAGLGLSPSPYLPAASCVTLAKFSNLPEPPPRPLRGCWETQSPLYRLSSSQCCVADRGGGQGRPL